MTLRKLPRKLTIPQIVEITDTSYSTIRRLIEDGHLPEFEKVGRNAYGNTADLYEFLSKLAARPVDIGDSLKSSKSLEKLFNASSTFIWQKFQKNKTMKEKAVYLRSRPYWLLSDIHADKELSAYLEVAQDKGEAA